MAICYECWNYDENRHRQCIVYNNECEPSEDATHCCEFIKRDHVKPIKYEKDGSKITYIAER